MEALTFNQNIASQYPIKIEQSTAGRKLFTVAYGLQVKKKI